jgi:ADP-ribosylation factor GTPase-activating protein 1
MEIFSHPDIPEILSLPGNSTCCDCGMEKPKWASLNNGVFLCLKCAGIHRSLGVDISTIRSLQIDSWTDKQILYLTNGGNNKLKQIWEEYGINPKSPVDNKYKSKACDYYRKYLKNLVEKISDKDYKQIELIKPSSEEGKERMEIKQGKEDVNNMNIIGDFNEPKKEEGFFKVVGNFLNSMKQSASEAANKITKEIDDLKLKDKLKEAGDKISDNAKIVGNFFKDKSQQALNSDFVQGITKTAESGINVVIEKTKVLLKKNEDQQENANVLLINDDQRINNGNERNEQKDNQAGDMQMSNVINNDNVNNNNDINNNINSENKINKEEEIKNEEKKDEEIEKEKQKKEEIKNEFFPKEVNKKDEVKDEINQIEEKVEEKKEENNLANDNKINNNLIGNQKLEEESVKFEPENPNGS